MAWAAPAPPPPPRQQVARLRLERPLVLRGERLERERPQGHRAVRALDLEGPREEAVDEQHRGAEQADEPLAQVRRDDPRAVRVGEHEVVELGQQPHGRRRAGIRERAVRHVEQLAPRLVAERA
jgi:hypothetical protein